MRSLIGAEELINKINDTYKGHMLEEQYSPLSFKNMIEELAENTTINAILIPEGATNGDMIKEMFPNVECREDRLGNVFVISDAQLGYIAFRESWWNAPYKGE